MIFILITCLQLYSIDNAQTFWQMLYSSHDLAGLGQDRNLEVNSKGHVFYNTFTGIYRSTDEGKSWKFISDFPNTSLDGGYTIKILNNDRILAGSQGVIFLSDDEGSTWYECASLHYFNDEYLCLGFATGSEETILAASWGGGVYISTNNGNNWTKFGMSVGSNYLRAIGVNYDGKAYAASDEWIYESTDNGWTWKNVGRLNTHNHAVVTNFAFQKDNTIFVGTSNEGVYISRDHGRNWQLANKGIEQQYVMSLTVDSSGALWVGTDSSGVFHSTNNGTSWRRVNSGITDSLYITLTISANGYMYAASQLGSIYRSVNPVTAIDEKENKIPTNFYLSQNYPNPFNPTTTINYSIPKTSFVSIKVYDVLGKEIAALVNEEKNVGSYDVKFYPRGLASGIYFYKMQSSDFIEIRKLVYLK